MRPRLRLLALGARMLALGALLLAPAASGREGPASPEPAVARPVEARPVEARPVEARPLAADREQLRRVMSEAGVATDRPSPGLTLWMRDAGVAVSQWMAGWMERVLPGAFRRMAPFFEPVLMVLLALLAAVLLALLVRFAFDRWRRRPPAAGSEEVRRLAAAAERPARRDWEGELQRRLESGDVAASIEALWWWLAVGLVGDRAEPSWTSRELVAKARRRDLLADVRRLDRLMYGAAPPSIGDVDRLWGDLREAVS